MVDIIPARRAGVSLGVALKRTKLGSVGDGGKKEPTSTSRAMESGGGDTSSGITERPTLMKSLLDSPMF